MIFRRNFIFFGFILFCSFVGYQLKKEIRPYNILSALKPDNSELLDYQKYINEFDDDRNIFMILENRSGIDLKNIPTSKLFSNVHEFLTKTNFINQYIDILNIEFIDSNKKESFKFTPLLLKDSENFDFFKNQFVSKNQKAALIVLKPKQNLSTEQFLTGMKELYIFKNKIERENLDFQVHLLGLDVARFEFFNEVQKAQSYLMPLVLIIISVCVYFLFKSLAICMFNVGLILLSYFLTASGVFILKDGLNPFTSFSLLFVLVVSTIDNIHIFSEINKAGNSANIHGIREAVSNLIVPCFICAVTTIVGMLSLYFSFIPPIQEFGLLCCVGVCISFLVTFFFFPWVVKFLKIELKVFRSWNFEAPVRKIAELSVQRRGVILFIYFGMLVASGFFCFQLKVSDDIYSKFIKNHRLTKAVEAMEENFHYLGTLDVVISVPEQKYREYAEQIKRLEENLKNVENVVQINSYTNLQFYIDSKMPDKKEIILSKYNELGILDQFLSKQKNSYRIVCFLKRIDSAKLQQVQKNIQSIIDRSGLLNELEVSQKGFSKIRSNIYESILDGFMYSFLFDFIGIFICFVLFFRSIKWGIIAILPNLLPLFSAGALIHLFNLKFDYNLIVLIAIIFGITVDDTTHLIYQILKKQKEGVILQVAIKDALGQVSLSLTGSTVIFILTMPAFLLTSISVFNQVAYVLTLSMAIGFITEIFVLPALIYKKGINL